MNFVSSGLLLGNCIRVFVSHSIRISAIALTMIVIYFSKQYAILTKKGAASKRRKNTPAIADRGYRSCEKLLQVQIFKAEPILVKLRTIGYPLIAVHISS